MFPRLLGVALLLAATLLALGSAAASSHEILVDPANDAYEARPEDAARTARDACWYGAGLGGEVCGPLRPPPSTPRADAGAPAPAGRDLVGLSLKETPDHLVVEIHVRDLDAGLATALPREGASVLYQACFDAQDCAFAFFSRAGGRIGSSAYYGRSDAGCGDYSVCLWPIDMEHVPGTPGTVRLTVPRVFLFDGDEGGELRNASMWVSVQEEPVGGATWTASTPLRAPGGSFWGAMWDADVAEGGRTFRFATTSTSTWDVFTATTREDVDGDPNNVDRVPDIDILSVGIRENETSLGLSLEVARVNETPPSMSLVGFFTLSTGPAVLLELRGDENGHRSGLSQCGDRNCTYMTQAAGSVDIVAGEPGWVNLTLDRADVGHPPAGTLVTFAYAYAETHEEVEQGRYGTEAHVTLSRNADFFAFAPPTRLSVDTRAPPAPAESNAVVVRDVANDVNPKPEFDTSAGMYDLVLAAVEGTSPTTTRVTIGVRDLSRIAVPLGWEAVVYSVALETDRGTTIVGYYREAERGDFFCATDTLVLTDEKRDPSGAAWTIIDGVLSVARGSASPGGGGGSSGPSTLTLFVPHSCFSVDTPGAIPARQIVGAIHLIPTSASGVSLDEIFLADEARDDTVTAFALGTNVPAPAEAPWYAQPFGIANFWDITGIVLAVVIALVGILAVRRKRSALRRYMEEIDRANDLPPKTRDEALVGLRRRVKADLVSGKIADAHFLVVEQRINEELAHARAAEISEAFGDMPHRLMQKLVEALADGTITRDEARRFGTLLEDSGLTEDSKAKLLRKLDHWVVEDAPSAG